MPAKEPMIDPRTWRVWRYALIGIAGGVALELAPKFIPGLKDAHGQLTPLAIWSTTILGALGIAWAYAFARRAFHASDEYRRATQQWAWYRGGVTGMMTATPLVVFFALGGLPLVGVKPPAFVDTGEAFAMGFAACALAQMLGYFAMRLVRAARP
jgi:hypothetical protein